MANMFEKYAADRETTITAIIHEWVQEHIEEVDE